MQVTHIGMDPGGSGGIGIIYYHGGIDSTPIHDKYCDLLYWVSAKMRTDHGTTEYRVIVEQVQGYIGNKGNKGGGFGNTGSSMFKFGQIYGALLMMLEALRDLQGLKIKYVTVPPNTWQRGLNIPPKGKGLLFETKTQYKARLAIVARRTFPQRKITLETADALLIAHYSKEVYKWEYT